MACPTCDHTMENVGCMHDPYHDVPLFWCPRCGTLKANIVNGENEVPKLVGRVIEFGSTLTDQDGRVIANFERCGIRESVTLYGLI